MARRALNKHETNPLVIPRDLVFKERTVRASRGKELVDPSSGEVVAVQTIYQRKIVDAERYAKIYVDGVARTFDLGSAARKVFSIVLRVCEKDTDRIYLNFMVAQQHKETDGISERTFQRGLAELIKKDFVAASTMPSMYWINVHLFFNGDRVRFMTEYVKCSTSKDAADRAALEAKGQRRLVD